MKEREKEENPASLCVVCKHLGNTYKYTFNVGCEFKTQKEQNFRTTNSIISQSAFQ